MTTAIAPTLGAGIDFTQLGVGGSPGYSAIDVRRADMGGPLQQGIGSTNGGDYAVAQRGLGANMSVDIAASTGYMLVQGNSVTFQGLYTVPPHPTVINEAINAADPTNPRIDQVFLQIWDSTHDGSGLNQSATTVLTGTPTSGATLANRNGAAAAPTNGVRLADVLVPASVSSIVTANIRDRRPWARGASNMLGHTAGNYTTSSATFALVDSTNLSTRLECSGVPLKVTLHALGADSVAGDAIVTGLWVDGAAVSSTTALGEMDSALAGIIGNASYTYLITTPTAGSHLFQPSFAIVTGGTGTLSANVPNPLWFMVEEFVKSNANNGTA